MKNQDNENQNFPMENEPNTDGNAEFISTETATPNTESEATEPKTDSENDVPVKASKKRGTKSKKSVESKNEALVSDTEKEKDAENLNDALPSDAALSANEDENSSGTDTETSEHANLEAPVESAPVATELSATEEKTEPEETLHVYGGEESIVDLLLGNVQKSEEPDIDETEYADDSRVGTDEEFEEMSLIPPEDNDENELPEENEESNDEDEPEEEPYNPEKPRKVDARFDFVELFIFTLALVMIVSSFFFRHSIVTGVSMESTLSDGDHIIISDLFYTPKRGDIIVCTDYTTAIKKPIVKRIIALGGDTVRITYSGETPHGEVYVNGVLLEEDYVYIDMPNYHYLPISEFTVPEGELFVMGDHRNESSDSRDPYVGTISEDSVLGRVLLRFYPFDEFGKPD